MWKKIGKAAIPLLFAMAFGVANQTVAMAAASETKLWSETAVQQLGAVASPVLTLKDTTRTGANVTSWTISFPKIPEGQFLYINVYESDPKKSETGYRFLR